MKRDRLEKIMAAGKTRYVVLHGVIGWGWLTAALVTSWTFYSKENMSTSHVVITFFIFSIGGVFWGLSTWRFSKRGVAMRALKKMSFPLPASGGISVCG